MTVHRFISWLAADDSGDGGNIYIEYALLLALVAVIAVAAIMALGDETTALADTYSTARAGAGSS